MARRTFVRMTGGLIAILAIVYGLFSPASAVTSSTTGAANGLKVSPVTTNITVNPGETQSVPVTVQNVTQSTISLQAIINDFIANNNETGEPALLLNGQYAPSHSLKRYVTPIADFTLKAGEQKTVNVTITIPKNVPGGGYYGAVRFAPSSSSSSNSNVTLSASVGSLVLVRVPGNVKEQLVLNSFDMRDGDNNPPRVIFTSNQGLQVVARFQNTGDVQEQPFGKVLLTQGGKQIASYELNNTTPRGNVLPDSIRKFTVTLDQVGVFGKYTVQGNFGYGTNGQLLSGETTFYVVPVLLIVVVAAVILLILFLIFVMPKMIRNYNRRVVERATRR